MNLKQNKQRTYQDQTPVKRKSNSIQLVNYFSRPSQDLQNKNENKNFDWSQKQNHDPNIDIDKKIIQLKSKKNQQQNSNQRTPKRKVIHLKSISKNSKSIKDGNSNSFGKKYQADHNYTQVAEFSDNVLHNRPAIKIDIDLKGHRKSMQDTLVSSNAQLQSLQMSQKSLNCDQHIYKKATFIVKGRPFCDKCSVKLITKGFVAVRIKNEEELMNEICQDDQSDKEKCDSKKRDMDLKQFIEQLDRAQPVIEAMGSKIDLYLGWLVEYFQFEANKLQENWSKLMKFLQNFKHQLTGSIRTQEEKAHRSLIEARQRIKEQTNILSFMRNDIVRNIDKIIDESSVPYEKYMDVMCNFKMQLAQVHTNTLNIQNSKILLPFSEIDIGRLDEQFHKRFKLKCTQEQLFGGRDENRETHEPFRLSFGKDAERVQSPTFKIL